MERCLRTLSTKPSVKNLSPPRVPTMGLCFSDFQKIKIFREAASTFRKIKNVTDSGQLMFFEFELGTKEE